MVSPCHYDLLHCYGLGVGVAAGRRWALELRSRALWYPLPGWFGGLGDM